MQAAVLHDYAAGIEDAVANLRIEERPVPAPGRGEVLVRMEAAPVNPSDLLFLQGLYGVKKQLPTVPGWEGAGTVVATGGGFLASRLRGKRVACGGQSQGDGTWAEYHVANAMGCIPLHAEVDFVLGANSLVNPLTALGLLDAIRRGKHRAAIQTAAVSQVGLMMLRLCHDAGIPLVNVVRREAQAQSLRAEGAEYVLDSSREDFEGELRSLAARLGATIAFDAVGGAMTGTLVGAMPEASTVVVYGALSGDACSGLDPIQLIFERKRVHGFYLGTWLAGQSILRRIGTVRRSQAMIASGTLKTNVARRIPLPDLQAGLLDYAHRFSEGKAVILLRS
jgi:NADPH:quinone reductase-like Zn-dependent oxidoreductase